MKVVHGRKNRVSNDCLCFEPQTNADRIRSMTDEELATMFDEYGKRNDCCPNYGRIDCRESCMKCWLDWLKQEVSDDPH